MKTPMLHGIKIDEWEFPAPPVGTHAWDQWDWNKYIEAHGRPNMDGYRFQLLESDDDKWRWEVSNRDGQVVLGIMADTSGVLPVLDQALRIAAKG